MSPQNGTKTGVQRDAKGRLVKGSGAINPGGRPKQLAHLKSRCQAATDTHVVDAWIEEVETHGPDWVKCSELLAAYGYGKPSSAPEDLEAVKDGARPLREAADEMVAELAKARR